MFEKSRRLCTKPSSIFGLIFSAFHFLAHAHFFSSISLCYSLSSCANTLSIVVGDSDEHCAHLVPLSPKKYGFSSPSAFYLAFFPPYFRCCLNSHAMEHSWQRCWQLQQTSCPFCATTAERCVLSSLGPFYCTFFPSHFFHYHSYTTIVTS